MKENVLDSPLSKFDVTQKLTYDAFSSEFSTIKQKFLKKKIALVLGAGVSMGSNLPSWNQLLVNILINCIDPTVSPEDAKLVSEAYLENKSNSLVSARFIKDLYDEERKKGTNLNTTVSFEDKVKSIIYPSKIDLHKNETLNAVYDICKDGKIKHIITYNYDDLLEQKFKLESISHKVISNNYEPANDDISIRLYHVHGFAPHDGTNLFNDKVLEEQDYHLQYSDIYNWQNLTQLSIFRDFTCVFIGVSLVDPNQRRLLDIVKEQCAKDKQPRHYWVGLRETLKKSFKEYVVAKNPTLLQYIENITHKSQEIDFESLNITPIFVDDYKEISKKIREIFDV